MKYLLFLLFPIIGFAQPNYSLSITPQYAFNKFQIGVTAIMEEKVATFQGHLFIGKNSNIETQVKMGFPFLRDCNSVFVVYPFYLDADVTNNRFFTPTGIAWQRTFEKLTFNVGADIYVHDFFEEEEKWTHSLNFSLNYSIVGNRYKNN